MTPMPHFTRDIVLVGGGHTHALVLRMLAMQPLKDVRLTLINPEPAAPYSGMLPGFIAGHYSSKALYIDLIRLARAAGARVILGKAHHIDTDLKEVHVANRPPIAYDICSIDVGITSNMPEIPGFLDNAIPTKPLDQFAASWDAFCSGTEPARIAVLGAGVAGAEVAMAAAHRMRTLQRDAHVSLIDRTQALSRLGTSARSKILSAMNDLGIHIHEHTSVAEITPDAVITSKGEIPTNLVLGAAGTRAYSWIAHSNLTLNDGYISVGPTLQSTSHPDVFAVGDCAHLGFAPRPKAGVFAVRQAPILAQNLKAMVRKQPLKAYNPQGDYLKLISLGTKKALAEKKGIALSGSLMWLWKDQIDRKFMDQFATLQPMSAPNDSSESQMLCAGCGSKVGRKTLANATQSKLGADHPTAQQLPGDDAGLLVMGDTKQVLTTDHLRAFNDDPVVMTRIAAIHALGDIWSMGATAQSAMVQIIIPHMDRALQERTLRDIMQTADLTMKDAGAQIIGGHTSMGAELTIGFSLTGLLSNAPHTHAGAQNGDCLILTKPIGTGVILAAEMRMQARGQDVANALQSMQRPLAQDAAILAPISSAMTDVTGFGLAGHLANFCRASHVNAQLNAADVPLLPGALDLAKDGIRSSIWPDNLSDLLPMMNAPETPLGELMCDPQTAGGLLASLPEKDVEKALEDLKSAGIPAACIGKISACASTDQPRITLVE